MSHFHELRAHLGLMKMTNVQNLPIVFGTKEFDDGTTARFQLIHGRESIDVFAPSPITGGEIVKTVKEDYERIVPVIRSVDDEYWVACLGGGFNGPYYAFRNIHGITAEQLEDNNEYDLDKTLISKGDLPLSETTGIPSLYFISQTGIRVDFTLSDGIGGNLTNSTDQQDTFSDLFQAHWDTLIPPPTEECYPNGTQDQWIYYNNLNHLFEPRTHQHVEYGGDTIPTKGNQFDFDRRMVGIAVIDTSNHYFEPAIPSPLDPKSFGGTTETTFDEHKTTIFGGSLEVADVSKGAFSLSYQLQVGSVATQDPYVDCTDKASRRGIDYGDFAPTSRVYNFQVEDEVFPYHTPPDVGSSIGGLSSLGSYDELLVAGAQECHTDHNMIKYYGEESGAKRTGIMCARIHLYTGEWDPDTYEDIPGECVQFMYNYAKLSDTKENKVITTTFPAEAGVSEHTIPSAEGIDNTTMFKGEIFMGRITATGKEVTTIEVV